MLRPSRSKPPHPEEAGKALTPLVRLLSTGGITRIELSACSGVNLQALKSIADNGEAVYRLPVSTLVRVAVALGCAPVELIPSLGMRPRTGLLWERGVFRLKRVGDRVAGR